MDRKFFEGLNLETELIEKIMAEHGKTTQALQKNLDSIQAERDGFRTQLDEVQGQLKTFEGVDVAELQSKITALNTDLTTAQENHIAELAKIKRHGETKDFMSGMKFVNDETREFYFNKLESALDDDANKGKGRKELLETLIAGEDGKPRANIFVEEKQTPPQYAQGTGSNPMIGDKEEHEKIMAEAKAALKIK